MEVKQQPSAPRKLRKIKRSKVNTTSQQPITFSLPGTVNQTNVADNYGNQRYFDDNGDSENVRFVTESGMQSMQAETIADLLKNKTVILLLFICAAFSIALGFFVCANQKGVAKKGLEGVVVNEDVPSGRSRCGLVEPHQGCVLYIMNPKNQEVSGRDFFTTAAQWTQRERYLIETGNMHYSTKRIKPGYIAQINIPPLSYR
jgi:hypothetical protein